MIGIGDFMESVWVGMNPWFILLIKCGANDWNWGLHGACLGGHESLVHLLIKCGANDWNWGLYGACQGGHESLIQLMINRGATECIYCHRSITDHR